MRTEAQNDSNAAALTRGQVEAMEKALGCGHVAQWSLWSHRGGCRRHLGDWTDLGCAVAVAAAHHEAAVVKANFRDRYQLRLDWKNTRASLDRVQAAARQLEADGFMAVAAVIQTAIDGPAR